MMELEMCFANTDADRQQVYRLRYEVYVEEMHMFEGDADHDKRHLSDEHDSSGHLVIARCGGRAIGSVRANWGGDTPISAEHEETYQIAPFLRILRPSQVLVVTRFVVLPEYRRSTIPLEILKFVTKYGCNQAVEAAFCDCQPHLVSMYLALGFRPYTVAYNDPAFGIMVPLVLISADAAHFKKVGSPLLPLFENWKPLAQLEALRRMVRDEASTRVAIHPNPGELWPEIHAVLDARRPDRPGLFDDVDGGEMQQLLERGHIIECRRGDVVIRRGQITRTVFVVLAGALQAQVAGKKINTVYPGECAGELAFLHDVPRTVDLVVSSDTVTLLSLNEGVLRRIADAAPSLAYKLMSNIARGLAMKLIRRDRGITKDPI